METDSIELLTVQQVSKSLRGKRDTIYKWCKRGILNHYKLDGDRGSVRIGLRDVKDFLNKRRVEMSQKPSRPPDTQSGCRKIHS